MIATGPDLWRLEKNYQSYRKKLELEVEEKSIRSTCAIINRNGERDETGCVILDRDEAIALRDWLTEQLIRLNWTTR